MPQFTARRKSLILAICCMSLLIVGMDSTIVNVALPSIRTDLGASVSGLQWVVDAYTLTLASLLILSGSTADRIGRRRTFQIGLASFTLGSALCSLAPNLNLLIVARIVQAVGGSMLNPVAMSIITNVFTERAERARAIGIWGGVVGISMGLGPVVGGVLIQTVGWRWIFWINIPIGIAAIVLARLFVPESKAPRARRFDPVGQLLVIVMLSTLTYAIVESSRLHWDSVELWSIIAVSVAALLALLLYEPRRTDPLIELRFFSSAPFSGATVIAVCAFGAFSGFLFLNSLYLQEVRGFSPLQAGFTVLPMAADDDDLRSALRTAGRRRPHPVGAGGRRLRDGDRRLRAHRDDRLDPTALPHRLLSGLRHRIRSGQRPDHQHGRIRDAEQCSRRRCCGGVHQQADRSHAGSGRDRLRTGGWCRRLGGGRRFGRASSRHRRERWNRMVDRRRLRSGRARPRHRHHRSVGEIDGRQGRRPHANRRSGADGRGGPVTSTVRPAEVATWRTVRETVMDHFAARRAEVSAQLGMSFVKAKALRRLAAGPLTMGELTADLVIDAPYTSVVVGDLVDRRLAVRTTHPADRRRKVVALTPEGVALAGRAQEILERPPRGIAVLTDVELETLARLFDRVAAAEAV